MLKHIIPVTKSLIPRKVIRYLNDLIPTKLFPAIKYTYPANSTVSVIKPFTVMKAEEQEQQLNNAGQPNEDKTYLLSPFDTKIVNNNSLRILVFDSHLDEKLFLESLSKTLELFPSFGSTLTFKKTNEIDEPMLALDESNPQFEVVIVKNEELEYIEDMDKVTSIEFKDYKDFLPRLDWKTPFLINGKPLSRFQLTYCKNGRTVLGSIINHAVADAYSASLFWKTLSDFMTFGKTEMKGQSKEHRKPMIITDRNQLKGLKPTRLPITWIGGMFNIIKWQMTQKKNEIKVFHFHLNKLKEMKDNLIKLNNNKDLTKFSSNDMLVALYFKSLALGNEKYADDTTLTISIVINTREIYKPAQKDYVGNCFKYFAINKSKKEILQMSISDIIVFIRKEIQNYMSNAHELFKQDVLQFNYDYFIDKENIALRYDLGNCFTQISCSNICSYSILGKIDFGKNGEKAIRYVPVYPGYLQHLSVIYHSTPDIVSASVTFTEEEAKHFNLLCESLSNK